MRRTRGGNGCTGFVLPHLPLLVSVAFSAGQIAKRSPTERPATMIVDTHTAEAYKPELLYRGDCEFSRALRCSQEQPLLPPRACTFRWPALGLRQAFIADFGLYFDPYRGEPLPRQGEVCLSSGFYASGEIP